VQRGRHRHRRQRRQLGGAGDHGAPGRERGGDRTRRVVGREVPRRDHADHADRLVQHHHPLGRDPRCHGVPVDALAFLGEPLEQIAGDLPLALRLGERLAALADGELAELSGALAHQLGRAHEDGRSLVGRPRAPGGERPLRRIDRAHDVGGAAERDARDHLLGRRVDHVASAAIDRVDPYTVDPLCSAGGHGPWTSTSCTAAATTASPSRS
jgi:hypothetical protein